MRIFFYKGVVGLLLLFSLNSCKKQDYDNGFKTFADVFFLTQNVASDLGVKVGNTPIDRQISTGKIRVPEGENTFVFYDKRNGQELGEKSVNVVANDPQTFLVFQPIENVPVAFLDPKGQSSEEPASEGFMKIKIANYVGNLIPKELDIVVLGLNMNMETIELATLESVTSNLEKERYRQVPTGGNEILAYTFKFRDRKTGEFLKNHGGEDYWNQNIFLYPESMSPIPEKRVYTIYLRSMEQWGEFPAFIREGVKYFEINPEILYAD